MAITTSTDDLNIIAALDDEPNDVGGLTPAQLKAKFDEAVLALQTYINTTLIPLLDAANLPYTYGSASTIKDEMDALVAGGVSDGSITTAKLDDGAATFAKGGHGGTTAAGGVYNLINALSGITPVSADKFPFLDSSGSTAGSVSLTGLASALQSSGALQISTGYYTGVGGDKTLSFSFVPQIVFISPQTATYTAPSRYWAAFMIQGAAKFQRGISSGTYQTTNGTGDCSWSGNSVTFEELNGTGVVYYYAGIGYVS